MSGKEGHYQKIYHVALDGSDSNPGTEAKPFRTIERARDVVRTVNENMAGDILVLLREGTYAVDRTVFDRKDPSRFRHGRRRE